MRPKSSLSGKTSVHSGRLAPPESTEIDAGQVVLGRDFLGAQVLLDGQREVGAALDGGVVADDDALAAADTANAGDDAGAVDIAGIETHGGELGKLQERGARIDQAHDAIAGEELAAGEMALAQALGAADGGLGALLAEVGNQGLHGRTVGLELLGGGVDLGFQDWHGTPSRRPGKVWRIGAAGNEIGQPACGPALTSEMRWRPVRGRQPGFAGRRHPAKDTRGLARKRKVRHRLRRTQYPLCVSRHTRSRTSLK